MALERASCVGHEKASVSARSRPRAGGRTPRTPRPGGGLALLRGLMLRMEKKFSSFLCFLNICEDICA